MELKFITFPNPTRSGCWAVAYGSVPIDEDLYDVQGNIKRKFIESIRFFKRKGNAERYKARVSQEHWNQVLSQKLATENRLN